MRFAAVTLVVTIPALWACSGSPQGSGQTGSVGPSADECRAVSDCEEHAAEELAQFTSESTSTRHFDAAECTNVGLVGGPSGPSCVCHLAGSSGTLNVGPAGLDCYAYGRGGDCLWSGADFDGCDVTDSASCDAVCAELEQRFEADAARTFEARTEHIACEAQECKTVIELDGRCFADRSYTAGRAYDCSLGGESILAAEQAAQQPPKQDEQREDRSSYVEGTDGMLMLTVSQSYSGTTASPVGFGAFAQFAVIGASSVSYGENLDPLEGVDDCGVFKGSGTGAGGVLSFYDAADVRLLDGATTRPLSLSEASHDNFYSYILELDPEQVEPRYGGLYGVHVAGGTFGASFDAAESLRLPQALTINELAQSDHFEQQDLPLTWTGSGDAPLYLHLIVNKTLGGFFESTELRCSMKDDGAFTIPAAVLQLMPTGFASATFEREDRRIVKSGSHSLLLHGSVQQTHRFALGPICDNAAALEACEVSAGQVSAAYEACGVPAPSLAEQCPAFIATACDACPEYFDCAAQQTQCTAQGLVTSSLGCTCAK